MILDVMMMIIIIIIQTFWTHQAEDKFGFSAQMSLKTCTAFEKCYDIIRLMLLAPSFALIDRSLL